MKDNIRNVHGVKDSINTYLNGYSQWTDNCLTKQDTLKRIKIDQKEYPDFQFIYRKQKEGYYRVYYKET